MNTNKVDGNSFERRLCQSLYGYGFWCHNMAQNKQGQPADIIAVRNARAYLIDCKVCAKNIFKMSRIEENQYNAMTLWEEFHNGDGWFALKLDTEEVFMIPFYKMREMAWLKSLISESEIRKIGMTLGEWVASCE